MLKSTPPPVSKFDEFLFSRFVPDDHYLRKVLACIDFEAFRPRLSAFYCPDFGRPAIDPVRMLKVVFLCFHYHLSDREVMARAATDMAFRWFLGLGKDDTVPDHTNGTHFRERLLDQGVQQIFQELIAQARAHGLICDRLRLKDATHMLADVADCQPIALVAQVREALWKAAKPFAPDFVSQQHTDYETLQQKTATASDEDRLAVRVQHLRALVATLQEHADALPEAAKVGKAWQRLQMALQTANKLLKDRDHPDAPNAPDRLASAVDPNARLGWHGEYYVGYMVDVAMDPVSEIITAFNVLPANGAEAADAVTLIRQEEEAQGNHVEGLSMDGAGYNGPVLRELSDPQGLNLDVTAPLPTPPERKTFPPDRFALTVLNDGTTVLTCPAGKTSGQGQAKPADHATLYRFSPKQCNGCPLREQCLENPAGHGGRGVKKNDYQAEYDHLADKAKTPEYQQTRRTHPKIERKINDLARHHSCRRARYRGTVKAFVQVGWTAIVVNTKRIVRLLRNSATSVLPSPGVDPDLTVVPTSRALPVRAEAAGA